MPIVGEEIHSGYLYKWTNFATGYKRRFFVLNCQIALLSYYKSQSEWKGGRGARSEISLWGCKIRKSTATLVIYTADSKVYLRSPIEDSVRRRTEISTWYNRLLSAGCLEATPECCPGEAVADSLSSVFGRLQLQQEQREEARAALATDNEEVFYDACSVPETPTQLPPGYEDEKLLRSTLPVRSCDVPRPGLLGLLRGIIGKDLAHLPLPCAFNEPLGMLQRFAEEFSCSSLLNRAAIEPDPSKRMAMVAAFAAASYASSYQRATKPFNPLLGETFEFANREYRLVAEQVRHHPPIAAIHVEAGGWTFWGDCCLKTRFKGKSLEVQPAGVLHLSLHACGEKYRWEKVTTVVTNLLIGKMAVHHHGTMKIVCESSGAVCELKFGNAVGSSERDCYPFDWEDDEEAAGQQTIDRKCRVVGWSAKSDGGEQWDEFQGFWNSHFTSRRYSTLWRNSSILISDYYGWTLDAIRLNAVCSSLQQHLPPTDSRLRPDQRILEEGNVDRANETKIQLEKNQRKRRAAPGGAEENHKPQWFVKSELSGDWQFNHRYWCVREEGKWNVPQIFNLAEK